MHGIEAPLCRAQHCCQRYPGWTRSRFNRRVASADFVREEKATYKINSTPALLTLIALAPYRLIALIALFLKKGTTSFCQDLGRN